MLMISTKLSIISPIAPTVMSQLQKSNPFRELLALAVRIKLKATISGAHRLLHNKERCSVELDKYMFGNRGTLKRVL